VLFLLRGQFALERNNYRSAEEQFQRAIVQAEALQDNDAGRVAGNLLGLARFLVGDYRQAKELHRQCLTGLERENFSDPLFAIEVLGNLAGDHFAQNETEQAIALYRRALDLYENVISQRSCQVSAVIPFARQYLLTSTRYREADKWALAREFATRALSLYKMWATHRYVGLMQQSLGKVRERLGDFDGAEYEYRRALACVQELMDDSAIALCHISLAELNLSRGNRDIARGEGEVALTHARLGADPQTIGEAMLTLGAIEQASKDYEAADTLIIQGLQLLEASHAFELASRGYARYANQLEDRGDGIRSLAAWKKAYSLRQASEGTDPFL
jgi:tetratricopeptide (TPR) repeat protein